MVPLSGLEITYKNTERYVRTKSTDRRSVEIPTQLHALAISVHVDVQNHANKKFHSANRIRYTNF